MLDISDNCLCGSGKCFAKCCSRFLNGDQDARTPEQLMRSRYCAYALGGHGEYLLNTWFPATATGLSVPGLSARSVDWSELQVISKSQSGDDGMVEFIARFVDADGQQQAMHEKSIFKRTQGHWLYVGGEVLTRN
ncbi:MAG: YchJ family protein [Pseudomonadales bacterium]